MLYELQNVKKNYDGRTVLDLEVLSLERGRVIGVLGPNGAGKTTLLEILAFLLRPSAGRVRFQRAKVDFSGGRLRDLRRKVVLVQQQPLLFTTSVLKNVEFPLRIRGTPKVKRNTLVEELLELVGMGAFRDAEAHRLSGGETQRVAIARALACSPEVVLLDEPTANVDVENQITIERIIGEINRTKGISVIFTTHNMLQASRLADETTFLFEGRLARSVYENIFSGQLEREQSGLKYCRLQNDLRLPVKTEKSGPVRISVDPAGLKMSRRKPSTSLESSFKGRLMQLSDQGSRMRALVDVGIPMSVLISKDVLRPLQVEVGEEIWLTCPAESIQIF